MQDHRRHRASRRIATTTAVVVAAVVAAFPATAPAAPIDRAALVARHMVRQDRIDPHAPVMLGNGQLGFTADITGLQSFPDRYSELAPLLTMAQWGWHSFPNPRGFREQDGWRMIPVEGRGRQPYAWMQSWADGDRNPAYGWLRANPHRISLGRIALTLGDTVPDFATVTDIRQRLDLWTGRLTSTFRLRGQPVQVTTAVHPTLDLVAVEIASPLVARGRDVIVLRTFSKIFGMAGMRMGFTMARPDILAKMMRYDGGMQSGALPLPSLACATASLTAAPLIAARRDAMVQARGIALDHLRARGIAVKPTSANMVMIDWTRPAKDVQAAFRAQSVEIGRSWPIWPTVSRVTVGSTAEMKAFCTALDRVIA